VACVLGLGGVLSHRADARQRMIAYLGELDEQGRLGVENAAQPEPWTQPDLFK